MGAATSRNKTEHKARAEYDVTSSILGKALAPIHCHVFAESLFWLGLAYSTARHFVAIFPGNIYGFLISCNQLQQNNTSGKELEKRSDFKTP